MKKISVLSSFILKIIALVSMVLDHIGRIGYYFYLQNGNGLINYDAYHVLTILGRISFPIICFLIVEGINHSKNPILYLSRLLFLSISLDLLFFAFTNTYEGNPVTSLFIGGLIIYLLKQKKIAFKLLSLIPFSIFLLMGFELIPLKAEYTVYGPILIILFNLAIYLSKAFIEIYHRISTIDKDILNENYYFSARKLISVLLFIIFEILIVVINPLWNHHNFFILDPQLQLYALLSIPFILLYSGQRGYDKPWFKYGCYLFYPLHVGIIYLIFLIF